jgi:hypothetical protein
VLANHVYNAQLVGRPYLLELVEDVEIAVRFARARLGARSLAIDAKGDARLLAELAGAALAVNVAEPRDGEPAFSWSDAVSRRLELWPIHYLLPGGGSVDAQGRRR